MGQALSTDPSIAALLRRAERRIRLRNGMAWAGRVGVVALAVVLIEGVVARVVALPDMMPALLALLALPVAVGAASWALRPRDRAVRAEAGRWIGEPALLLALDAGRETELHPLVASQAHRRAGDATAPARRFGRLTRALPLLYLPAVLIVFAPGRVASADRLPDPVVTSVRQAGRALKADGLPASVSPDRQQTVGKALRDLDDPTVSRDAVEAAIAQLQAALREAGGTWDAFTDAASKTALLEPTWQAMDRGEPAAALRAIEELARKIREGQIQPSDLRLASEALIAAASGAGSTKDRALLDAAGKAMAAGDGSGLQRAMSDLASGLRPPGSSTRRMKRTVVALEQALGRPGDGTTSATPGSDAALEPRDPTVDMARNAFGDLKDLDPLQREILRNYFTVR